MTPKYTVDNLLSGTVGDTRRAAEATRTRDARSVDSPLTIGAAHGR